MRKTQYYAAASLDGFIADDAHGLDWLFQFTDIDEAEIQRFTAKVGAIAMGSATYEWILKNQVQPASGAPQPWPYEVPVWVFSSRELPVAEGADIRFVKGAVAPVHHTMVEAAGDRNLWVMGGGDLAGQFHDAGLLDEIIVSIASVTLGSGFPLLPRRISTPPLKLISVDKFGSSFAVLHYQVTR